MCFINNTTQPLGNRGGWRMAMWCLIIQGTWNIKSAESRQHPPLRPLPVIIYSYLSFFLLLFHHLAAFQSIPINIQCLCTLSSCLSKWHNPWQKNTQMTNIRFFPLLYFYCFYVHPQQIIFWQINQHLLMAVEEGKRMNGWFLSACIKERTAWKLLRSWLFTTAWVSATRDIISFTVMLKHNTIMQ